MNKRPINKLVSVILTVAVCITTVFGCFVSVSAAETPSYIITGAQCNQNDTVASALVEFSVPQGIAAGIFTIDNTDNWYSSVAVTLYSDLAASTDSVNIDSDNGNVTFYITDDNGNAKLYTNIVFKLDFVFADGGIQEDIDITISGLDFNGLYYDEIYTDVDFAGTNGLFTAGCRHSFVVSDEEVYTSDELGYTVFDGAVCSQCGETKNDYQVVPNAETSGEIVIYTGSASTAPAVELLDANSANSESNPYIIETPTQIHSLAMGALKNTAGEVLYNKGAYFKVADGISAFILQSSADVETIMNLSSADEVKTYLSNLSGKTSWWTSFTGSNGQFSGHFDGNGVKIYGLYGAASGAPAMFPVVTGTSSFKNFTIKNSYFAANSGAGVAAVVGKTPNDTVVDTITFNNVTVANNYIEQTGNHAAGASAIIGVCNSNTNSSNATQRDAAKIYNCLVYGNNIVNDVFTGTGLKSGLITDCSGNSEIKNVISLGVTPWTLNSAGWYLKQIGDGTIANVFTDASQEEWNAYSASNANNSVSNAQKYNINYAINPDDLKGDKAAVTTATLTAANKAANSGSKGTDLDWNTKTNPNGIWFTGNGGQYPSLLKKAVLDVADSTNYEWKLLGVNIEYQNDGGFTLNFHFESSYDTDISLYLANANEEYKSQILTEYTTSSFAGTTLSADAKMFTVSNLSAKDMDILWLPTIVATSKTENKTVYSETKQISITDYATAVVLGECFYDEDATEEEKSADKTVAAALINYGNASSNALAITTPSTTSKVVEKWDNISDGVRVDWYDASFDGKGDGTKDNPYIITSAEELANLCRYGSNAGVYYKVDDNIKAFDMNNSGIDLSSDDVTAEYVKQQLADVICGKVWACDAPFKGNFDGNGVEIYGLRAGPAYYNQTSFESGSKAGYQYGGLFGRIDTSTATIKNVKIKNSYFIGESAGAIFGYTEYTNGSVKIENCSVVNCYIESTSNSGNDAGAIGGMCRFNGTENISDKVLINNCIVYGNAIVNKTGNKNLIGVIDAWHYNGSAKEQSPEHYSIKNTIAIGCNIAKNNYWTNADALYLNCYTTETTGTTATTVKKLSSADDAKGAAAMSNMSQLDWDNVWLFGDEGEYPTIAPRVDNENAKGAISIRSQTNESQPFVLKDPSKANSESNPYLVETAAQMYMLMRGVPKDSNGTNISTTGNSNYFKVADGIDAFYMTSIDIGELNSAADVKAWFENPANTDFKKVWSGTPFSGHFDGNGVEIYGVRSDDSVAALFPIVAGTTTIKNVTVKNSYLKGSDGAAGIVCKTTNGNNSTVTIENCKLINCYVEAGKNGANAGAASVVGFSYGSPIIVNDVIIYGNQFVSPSGHSYGLVSYGWSSASKFTNIISIGHEPYRVTDLTTGANASYHYTKNEAFVGVYTDKIAQGAYYDASGDKTIHYFNYNESQVKQLAVSEMMGPGAVQNMPHLSWAENGGDWYAGALGDYPSFEPAGMLQSDLQAQYDSISFGVYDNYGNSTNTFGVYTTALSLKANPYISFAFAFHGDYKVNRDKIKIRFTYTENGAKVTSGEVSVPAYNGEDIVNVNGWTNTAKNGRYHTYKAENIPVEALANGIKVEANYNNTGWIDFGTYSAGGLGIQFERLNRNNPCDYYETRVEAVKALLFYVQAIQLRYGAQ